MLLVLLSAEALMAQFTGKPRYNIMTRRDTVFLGNIIVEMFPAVAPNHVKNFDSLVSKQFYDSTAFHRVIPGFMIQGGDPNSKSGPRNTWGFGQPWQPTVNAEFSVLKHVRGILSAARDNNINSANSQFFICVASAPWLDTQYSIYGKVLSGMNIVDTIVNEPRDANDNPWKKIDMFITYLGSNDTITPDPVLDTPVNGTQNIVTTNQLCKWFAVNDAIMYHIEVAKDSLFTTTFWSKDVTTPYNTITGLTQSNNYFWRVKATNGGNWSGWSPTWKFSTIMNNSVQDLAFTNAGYKLGQNQPNPAGRGETTVEFTVPGRESVRIVLFDASGRQIEVLTESEFGKGDHKIQINTQSLSSGSYYYRMEAGGLSATRTMIIE